MSGNRDQVSRTERQTRSGPALHVVAEGCRELLVSRAHRPTGTVVDIDGVNLGLEEVVIMAGPCSVESAEQILRIAREVKEAGATALRGGAFKPRTSPYDFQGLGQVGLQYLKAAYQETGLKIVTEVLAPIDVPATDGEPDDITAVDAHVRRVMQTALHRLARRRRVPLLG